MRPLVLLLFLAVGCDTIVPEPSVLEPSGRAARSSTTPVAGTARAAANVVVSLRVSGRVTVARGDGGAPPGHLIVALTDGPCFEPGTHYLALAATAEGVPFELAAFPPRGSRLEVCAAQVDPPGRRTRFWGRSGRGPIVAGGSPRVEGVDVQLARVPMEIALPEGLKLP